MVEQKKTKSNGAATFWTHSPFRDRYFLLCLGRYRVELSSKQCTDFFCYLYILLLQFLDVFDELQYARCLRTQDEAVLDAFNVINWEFGKSYPLLHFKVCALDKHRQAVDQQLGGFLGRGAVAVPLLALQDGGKELGRVLHVHSLDVTRKGGHLGPEHGLQRLHWVLQMPTERRRMDFCHAFRVDVTSVGEEEED